MENFSKDIVKKLLDKKVKEITDMKDLEIKKLKEEIEVIKLEKTLNNEFNTKQEKEETKEEDLDKILGGLYE